VEAAGELVVDLKDVPGTHRNADGERNRERERERESSFFLCAVAVAICDQARIVPGECVSTYLR